MNIVDSFAKSLNEAETLILDHVRAYIEWQSSDHPGFSPSPDDDASLRTYFLKLQSSGTAKKRLRRHLSSLQRFYEWSESTGRISSSPFQHFKSEIEQLLAEDVKQREDTFSGTPQEREIARLTALNKLAEQVNRSPDMQTTLLIAMETLLSLLNLRTAWAFLLPAAASPLTNEDTSIGSDFSLAASIGLPPGLEQDDRYFLRSPSKCQCQALLEAGKLHHAVNIIECTRLKESTAKNGDNRGLRFHASIPILGSSAPLGILNVATQDWQLLSPTDLQLLSAIGSQVAIALERARYYDLTHAHRLRFEQELKMAREVQVSLLPEKLPDLTGYSLAVDWRFAREMAGDFYDIIPLNDDRWGILVADVSDKGAPAAMYMATTCSLIRSSAGVTLSPSAVLNEVNRRLLDHSSSNMFVTVFYALLDTRTHMLTYANAGHNPPLLKRRNGKIEQLTPTGPALGVMKDAPRSEVRLTLSSEDSLVMYTDGLTDALNPAGEEYGLKRLLKSVASAPSSAARLQMEHLTKELAAFTQGTAFMDDITIFIVTNECQSASTD